MAKKRNRGKPNKAMVCCGPGTPSLDHIGDKFCNIFNSMSTRQKKMLAEKFSQQANINNNCAMQQWQLFMQGGLFTIEHLDDVKNFLAAIFPTAMCATLFYVLSSMDSADLTKFNRSNFNVWLWEDSQFKKQATFFGLRNFGWFCTAQIVFQFLSG